MRNRCMVLTQMICDDMLFILDVLNIQFEYEISLRKEG